MHISIKSIHCAIDFPVLQVKYRERAIGLILVSPLCRKPSWTEWFYDKVDLSGILVSWNNFTTKVDFQKPHKHLEYQCSGTEHLLIRCVGVFRR